MITQRNVGQPAAAYRQTSDHWLGERKEWDETEAVQRHLIA